MSPVFSSSPSARLLNLLFQDLVYSDEEREADDLAWMNSLSRKEKKRLFRSLEEAQNEGQSPEKKRRKGSDTSDDEEMRKKSKKRDQKRDKKKDKKMKDDHDHRPHDGHDKPGSQGDDHQRA